MWGTKNITCIDKQISTLRLRAWMQCNLLQSQSWTTIKLQKPVQQQIRIKFQNTTGFWLQVTLNPRSWHDQCPLVHIRLQESKCVYRYIYVYVKITTWWVTACWQSHSCCVVQRFPPIPPAWNRYPNIQTGWWFQPNWKILVKLEIFPKEGVKIKKW